jgi:hypothetical protein
MAKSTGIPSLFTLIIKRYLSEKRLTAAPLVLRFDLNEQEDEHELTMVAENLGTIPP